MASDVLKGRWQQFKGEMKIWWGDLSDNDIEKVEGDREKLIGVLQEKYGWDRHETEKEIDIRTKEFKDKYGEAA
jgi:uncharacterized protein YjbJ (UPF0337 family)